MAQETLVKKIHTEFRESLNSSLITTKELTKEQGDAVTAVRRLENLGLHNTKTYKKFRNTYDSVQGIEKDQKIISAIQKFELAYPSHRLIGLKRVIELCDKYNLYISHLSEFTGIIPNKNLSELEAHRNQYYNKNIFANSNGTFSLFKFMEGNYYGWNRPTYFIAAPRQDFPNELHATGRILQEIDKPKFTLDFKVSMNDLMPDPIVLAPIDIQGARLFQVVTAWGAEKDDDYVTKDIPQTSSNN